MNETDCIFRTTPRKGMAFLLCLLLLSSCREEELVRGTGNMYSDIVSFGITAPQGWSSLAGTRSDGDNRTDSLPAPKTVELGETPDGEKLMLHLEVSHTDRDEAPQPDSAATRAAMQMTEGTLGVYSYQQTGSDTEAPTYGSTQLLPFMDNQLVNIDGGQSSYNPQKSWPGAGKWLKFFAYSPHTTTATNLLTSDGNNGQPTLTYTVPAEITQQKDLLSTRTNMLPGDYNQSVELPFRHILSAVNFKVGTMPFGSITEVGLKGLAYKGVYNLNTGKWTLDPESHDFTQGFDPPKDAATHSGPLGTSFLMMPQEFADATPELYIKFNVNNPSGQNGQPREYTLEHSLKGLLSQWQPGKEYTFTISIPKEVKVSVTDKNDGKTKSDLVMKNEGVATVFIRATMVGDWVEYSSTGAQRIVKGWDSDNEGHFDWGSNTRDPNETIRWRKGGDGFYYYMTPIRRNETIATPLFKSYTLNDDVPYPDAELQLTIAIQAVAVDDIDQMKGKSAWDDDVVDILITRKNNTQDNL